MMDVSAACQRRSSVRAFTDQAVPEAVLREILELAQRGTPSGGNLQPWHVYALAGAPLQGLKRAVAGKPPESAEYDVYPPGLFEPYRSRRFVCGEDLYAT